MEVNNLVPIYTDRIKIQKSEILEAWGKQENNKFQKHYMDPFGGEKA